MINLKREGHWEWEEVPVAGEAPLMRQHRDKVMKAVHIWGLCTSGGWGSRQNTARVRELNGAAQHLWSLHGALKMFGSLEGGESRASQRRCWDLLLRDGKPLEKSEAVWHKQIYGKSKKINKKAPKYIWQASGVLAAPPSLSMEQSLQCPFCAFKEQKKQTKRPLSLHHKGPPDSLNRGCWGWFCSPPPPPLAIWSRVLNILRLGESSQV